MNKNPIHINDTTLRGGEQAAGVAFNVTEKWRYSKGAGVAPSPLSSMSLVFQS